MNAAPTVEPGTTAVAERVLAALARRVAAGCRAVGLDAGPDLGQNLEAILIRAGSRRDDVLWLAAGCVLGRAPTAAEVAAARRLLDVSSVAELAAALLAQALATPAALVRDAAVVLSATVLLTGGPAELAQDEEIGALAPLLLAAWAGRDGVVLGRTLPDGSLGTVGTGPPALLLPWHGTVVVLGPLDAAASDRVASLARLSGSRVTVLVPDLLPVVRPERVPVARSAGLAHLLGLVKHAHRVVALTGTTARGYRGFGAALAAQGLPGPQVRSAGCALDDPGADAGDQPAGAGGPAHRTDGGAPVLLSIGDDAVSETTVLAAARALWDRGTSLRLRFTAPPRTPGQAARIEAARSAGHDIGTWPVHVGGPPPPAGVHLAIALSPGGQGLRLHQVLGGGTPAVVTAIGVPGELALAGGCRVVDAADDDDVVRALTELLTDDVLRAELARAAAARPRTRTGADDLWDALTGGHPG